MCTCYHMNSRHWQGSQVPLSTCQGTHVLWLPTSSTSLALIANIIWQLLAKKVTHDPHHFFSMLQCSFDEWLNKSPKNFTKIRFFVRNGLPVITWKQRYYLVSNVVNRLLENVHQVVWDSLMNYDRIEWQRSLKELARAPDMAYMKIFSKNLIFLWCVTLSPIE